MSIIIYTNDNGYVRENKDMPKQELLNIENGFNDRRFIKIFRNLFDSPEKAKVIDL